MVENWFVIEVVAQFDDCEVRYGFGELDSLVPEFATTIHKGQVSEYPAVVIPVVTQHYPMLQRNLPYTGVTRGKCGSAWKVDPLIGGIGVQD